MRPIFVAEMTINHLGMLKIAIVTMEKLKNIGIDFFKFKIKDVENYYKKDDKKFNGYSFHTYRNSLELTHQDFINIDNWCKKNNLNWYATAHDAKSVETISKFNPPFLKIASMDAQNKELINATLKCNKNNVPIIVSVGGLSLNAIDKIVNNISSDNQKLILLHTVSIYPTPIEKTNIKRISTLKKRYSKSNVEIGYSGHEEGYIPSLLAAQSGAYMIERHVTLTKNLNIHHIKASLTTNEFKEMIEKTDELLTIKNSTSPEFHEEENEFLIDRKYF